MSKNPGFNPLRPGAGPRSKTLIAGGEGGAGFFTPRIIPPGDCRPREGGLEFRAS